MYLVYEIGKLKILHVMHDKKSFDHPMVEMLLQSLIPPYHLVMIGEGFSVLFAGDTYTRSREREEK